MPEEEKIYTIEDIAKELGVSTTTVSRAISGKGRISQKTRERVKAFIKEHNYRPNPLAKGLAQNKTYNIGLVLPPNFATEDLPFFRECMSGICEIASENNYDVVISMIDGHDFSQIRRILYNRKVDGVIVSQSGADGSLEKLLQEKNMPFVVIGPCREPGIPSVDNDNREACRELTGILLMKGVGKLALIGGSSRNLVTESRKQGFLDAHRDQGTEPDEGLIFTGVDSYLTAAQAVEEALEAGAGGILCMDDIITGQVLSCLRQKGIQIPGDIRLASFYDSIQLERNSPTITSLRFESRELGQNACRLLLELIEGKHVTVRMQPSYQVILRESTK